MDWSIVIWLAFGAVAGGISSLVLGHEARRERLIDVAVGGLGASLGGIIFFRGDLALPSRPEPFIVALLTALILLAIVNIFRRGRSR